MISQEKLFADQLAELIGAFQANFPTIPPPDTQWFYLWREKYPVWAIKEAIQTLAAHPLKAKFSTDSCGKALSASLRAAALKRALASVTPKIGGPQS
jgi:hypothetical protein